MSIMIDNHTNLEKVNDKIAVWVAKIDVDTRENEPRIDLEK